MKKWNMDNCPTITKEENNSGLDGRYLSNIKLMDLWEVQSHQTYSKGIYLNLLVGLIGDFLTVEKLNIVRILLSLATNLKWLFCQFNIKNAFLQAEPKGKIYMDIPLVFTTPSQTNVVCKP